MTFLSNHASAYVSPDMTAREIYRAVHSYLRLVYGQYDAFDTLALDRVETFNFYCIASGRQYEAVDSAFRSWEAVGIHRPITKHLLAIEARRALHYRQLIINS